MRDTVDWEVPHGGAGTHTLGVAVEVDDAMLDDPGRDDEILERLTDLAREELVEWRARKIVARVIHGLGVTLDELRMPDRNSEITKLRHELMLRLREAGWSYPRIGWLLARDHTTVMHGCRRARQRRAEKATA